MSTSYKESFPPEAEDSADTHRTGTELRKREAEPEPAAPLNAYEYAPSLLHTLEGQWRLLRAAAITIIIHHE